jgi:hypothetical protein
MTVISTYITKRFTVHATDSLITRLKSDGTSTVLEWEKSKIVPVRHWRGAMSYWGLATTDQGWSTLDWLRAMAQKSRNYQSVEEFAEYLAHELTQTIYKFHFKKPSDYGLGIHFTAYENIENYWIPELFKISNWTDNSYSNIHRSGFRLERVTYGSLNQEFIYIPEHRDLKNRLEVQKHLQNGNPFVYNNGDPFLFNASAYSIWGMIGVLKNRGILADLDKVEKICALTRRPIEIVSNVQRDFCSPGTRLVGGRPHDLAITPNGDYWSSTGEVLCFCYGCLNIAKNIGPIIRRTEVYFSRN